MRRRLLVLTLISLLTPVITLAAPITSIVVIGDSLSDQGNGFLLTGGTFPPPPYAGRASNGPVAVEYLAQRLGVPLTAAAAGGTNYAVLGALTGTQNAIAATYSLPALAGTGMLAQTAAYLASGPVADPSGTLFVVWGGPNDLLADPTAGTAANALNNLAATISALYFNGARRFLVPNMPDLSLTPFGRSLPPASAAALQMLVAGFNSGLSSGLNTLGSTLPGIDIRQFDTFALLTAIVMNPGAYGFSNGATPCLTGDFSTGAMVCADPASYVFWDSLHPTTAAHAVLGNAFAGAVPEPTTLSLLLAAGMIGGRLHRRRMRHRERPV